MDRETYPKAKAKAQLEMIRAFLVSRGIKCKEVCREAFFVNLSELLPDEYDDADPYQLKNGYYMLRGVRGGTHDDFFIAAPCDIFIQPRDDDNKWMFHVEGPAKEVYVEHTASMGELLEEVCRLILKEDRNG